MISREVFSQRLNKLRQIKNISHEKLAAELGLTRTTVSHWENGLRLPSLEVAAELAGFFNVSLDYLIGRSDDPRCALCFQEGSLTFDVSKRLRELRKNADMTIYRLSKESQVEDSFLRALEKENIKNITVNVLSKICDALGVTLAEFFQDDKVDFSSAGHKRLQLLIAKLSPKDIELLIAFTQRIVDGYDSDK